MAVTTITINSTDISNYLAQEVGVGFEYRTSDEGMTANGSHYQNIIAKKRILTLNFRPLTIAEYSTIETLFKATDQYTVAYTQNEVAISITCYRIGDVAGSNIGDMFVKKLTIKLKEI